jgi:hypothetical protein
MVIDAGRDEVSAGLGGAEHPCKPLLAQDRRRGGLTHRATHTVEAHANELWKVHRLHRMATLHTPARDELRNALANVE